jgi:Fe-S oxidoreductase
MSTGKKHTCPTIFQGDILMDENKMMHEPLYMDQEKFIEELKTSILDAASRCRSCNYCLPSCPLFDSTRGFMSQSPTGLMQSVKYAVRWDMLENEDKEALRDLLYLCTTCNSCVLRCKAKASAVPILDAIQAGRKLLRELMIGPLPAQRKVLKDIFASGNPYGENPESRMNWLGSLPVKRIPRDKANVLLFVGCTTCYDPKLHSMGRNMVRLLQALNVDFGVHSEETCCGDPARRLGDEALFQEIVSQNIDKFVKSGVQTVVTISPHCFNAFTKEYQLLNQNFKIQHYTQYLADLLQNQEHKFQSPSSHIVVYHDPCYLGKHNQIFEPPRRLLQIVEGMKLVEMPMNHEDSLCCGGGGGRMYADVEDKPRLAETRIHQAVETGAGTLATACPWCYTMLTNAVEDMNLEDNIKVKDVAEILFEAINTQ